MGDRGPASFSNLDRPAQFLKGVGPSRAEALVSLGITTARELLYHTPRRYDDASTVQPVRSLHVGMDATVVGRVRSKGIVPTRKGLRIFQAVLQDETGMITVAWPGQPWLDRKIREGDTLLVTGPVRFFHGRQLHPREHTLLARAGDDAEPQGTIFVVYPASEEVPQWVLRGIFQKNLDALLAWADDDEWLSEGELEALGLPRLSRALTLLHRPSAISDARVGRRRLAYDELFFLQVVQAQARRRQADTAPGVAHRRTNERIRPLHEALPFQLTDAQAKVLREIFADMTSERRMSRLLQGDVGSGKTVVARFAMLLAVEGGHQAALMAPTEILAEQHARKMGEMVAPLGLEMELLSARLTGA
ncbi:MAG: DEAD/DEAH box helicase, partial [Gemmatimonadetes bacterium]|nr:DEAD/DEAH box helicase [Gemmatimonadota bacterium]